jgi:hypothetical protein
MHKPYSEITKHEADFRVKYKFYTHEEGGRKIIPYQGIRCDFVYDNSDIVGRVWMIWPEFEDEHGNIILDNTKSVPESGTAKMWIINKDLRDYHSERIKVGLKCNFWEGKRTADCEVIEILGLYSNPKGKT